MHTQPSSWQQRFGLTICAATDVDPAIPPAALGVAVVYEAGTEREITYYVLESRAGNLRDLCARRLLAPQLPPLSTLMVAFKAEVLDPSTPETIHTACRAQVNLAAELRRERRPSMR